MFERLFGKQKNVATKAQEQATVNDELVLGAFCSVPDNAAKSPEKEWEERRGGPRLVQHTPSLNVDSEIYMRDDEGYFNIKNPERRISFEKAAELQVMPRPDLSGKINTELLKFKQRRTGMRES